MREIIFDTETTGFHALEGDRITEIGCVEVVDLIPTGRELQHLVNPERDIPKEVTQITGHTVEMLRDKPKFREIAQEFLDFIGDATLVAHNARFDMSFINMELERCGKTPIAGNRFKDTAVMARERFPGSPASLDALCKRFDISLGSRIKHGALIDAYLLAEVYLELNGGREQGLSFDDHSGPGHTVVFPARPPRPEPLPARVSDEERAAHEAFLETIGGDRTLWKTLGLV